MQKVAVILLLFYFVNNVLLQGTGSGNNGNLRLCVVEGRGTYKRTFKYCPVLDKEDSGVECVLGTDRLDCLRRISKGTVDFGAFSPEDLMAAQWANIDVLVTNELRSRSKSFERSVVAVVNRRVLSAEKLPVRVILKNSTLCHPGADVEDLRPLSDTLAAYLEFQVLSRDCLDELSLAENRIKALADYFGSSCKAGPWVVDKNRDAQLKRKYSSLCSSCASSCSTSDRYWGSAGSLSCLVEVGDVVWAELVDVKAYFGLHQSQTSSHGVYPQADNYAYLCRDGSWQSLDIAEPCVWLQRPWPVIVAKRKASEAVAKLALSLHNRTVTVDPHWRGALAALLEIRQAQPEPLQPPVTPFDYLARARGFREAYSQTGCVPSRHITFCTTSLLEKHKCDWLSEAGAVYGVTPAVQCAFRNDTDACVRAVAAGDCHVMQADSNWLVKAERDYNLVPVLHEATPIMEKTHTVVAYVRADSKLNKMADLRGKRATFPEYDGAAWHSVLRYLKNKNKMSCRDMKDYFSEICAPGVTNVSDSKVFTTNCYDEGLNGELQALKSLVEGRSDVAFISMETYNTYTAKLISEPWANQPLPLKPVCPDDNNKYCFISWSNIGHIFAPKNITAMRHQEIVNVFTKLDQLFGKQYPFHNAMFSMYGPFNHQLDVLFHNSTKNLITEENLNSHPYSRIPMNFERSLLNSTDSCQAKDFVNFGAQIQPGFLVMIISLVVYVIS